MGLFSGIVGALFGKEKTPKPPPAPDPVATAQAQGAANAEVARINQSASMVDQYTPGGSLTYSPLGGDRWRADVQLSPQQFDLQNRNYLMDRDMLHYAQEQLGRVGNTLATPMDTGSLPGYAPTRRLTSADAVGFAAPRYLAPTNAVGFADRPQARDTQNIAQLMQQRESGSMNAQRDALRTQMMNQGIREGTEAWQRGMDDWNRQQNDFQIGTQLAAGQEQSRMYGIDRDSADYQNQLRAAQIGESERAHEYHTATDQMQNALRAAQIGEHERAYQFQTAADQYQNQLHQSQLQEQAYIRQLPINEISALISGAQVQGPNFVNTPGYQQAATPVADSTYGSYQGQLNNYNSQLQSQAANQQGMYGLLGAGLTGAGLFFGR